MRNYEYINAANACGNKSVFIILLLYTIEFLELCRWIWWLIFMAPHLFETKISPGFTFVFLSFYSFTTCGECKFLIYANKCSDGAKQNTHKRNQQQNWCSSIDWQRRHTMKQKICHCFQVYFHRHWMLLAKYKYVIHCIRK